MSGFLITPSVQHYHWGKRGKQSRVALLIDSVDPAKAYAEAWYGDHEKSPSFLRKGNQTLHQKIASSPKTFLGTRVLDTFGPALPFLFKVLSVDAPLSIQVHPSKEQAKDLNLKDSKNYPDDNHKPEIVVALSEFEVLSGFKDAAGIRKVFELFPELGLILGKELFHDIINVFADPKAVPSSVSRLSDIIERFYGTDPATLQRVVALTIDRLERSATADDAQKLFLQLVGRGFESDPGVFVALFLQHKTLQPGEAMYTPARVLHAYLKGDAIECMANSDNVVRAGLTPKHQDVTSLLQVVDWTGAASPTFFPAMRGEAPNSVQRLQPPTKEFTLDMYRNYNLPLGRLGELGSPEMVILLEGSAETSFHEKMEIGDAFFIPADCTGDNITTHDAFLVRVSVP